MNCLVAGNHSTATSRRRKWYVENVGEVQDGQVPDASCGNPACHLPEHVFLRPKIELAKWKKLFGHVIPQIEALAIGETVGVLVPEGYDPEDWAKRLRSHLHFTKPLFYVRWGVRLRSDNVVVVKKLGYFEGTFGGTGIIKAAVSELEQKVQSLALQPPKLCECGCGRITAIAKKDHRDRGTIAGEHVRFIRGHHNKIRHKDMTVCPGCGKTFHSKGRQCCSRPCAFKFKITKNRQRPDNAATMMERGFRRKKCDVCGRFFWAKPYLARQSCSVKCKQIKCLRKKRKIPDDRVLLHDLFMVKKWSYRKINEHFGCHPQSIAAYRACREMGFPRRARGVRNNPPNDPQKVAVMYQQKGMSVHEIAASFPCSATHISNLLNSAGIKPHGRVSRGSTPCLVCGKPGEVRSSHGRTWVHSLCMFHRRVREAERARKRRATEKAAA